MILRSSNKNKDRIIWFDIETTGFNIFHDEIIEIAAVDSFDNEFSHLIKSTKPLKKKITELTGITDDMLVNQETQLEVLTKFKNFIENENDQCLIIIGHNSNSFDIPFIKSQFSKFNLKFPKYKTIDTMRLAQYVLPNEWSYSLKNLCSTFGVKNTNAHRALSDVHATRHIYNNLLIIYKSRNKDSINTLSNIIKKTQF